MGLIDSAKNLAAQKALKFLVEKHAGAYADLRELSVDTRKGSVALVLRPKGPDERDLDLRLRYVINTPAKTAPGSLRVTEAESSRPWLQALARDHLVGRTFELPKTAATLLG